MGGKGDLCALVIETIFSTMKNIVPISEIIRNITSHGVEYTREIKDWLEDSPDNEKIYLDLQNVWQITGAFPKRFIPNRPLAWQKVKKQIQFQKRKFFLYRRAMQIAAAIVIVFLSVWGGTKFDNLRKPTYSEIISPAGQKTRIILPDSSIVLLNSESQIRYSNSFNENNRKLELHGEAYFEVHKDISKQFIVHTSDLDIKVYGTSFNVKAYGDDQTIEVALKSGQVGIDRNKMELTQLTPGEVATFNKKIKKLDVEKMDIDLVSAWTRNEMIFEENSLEEIVKYMERWFGVQIDIAPELLDGGLFTFKVKNESLIESLKLIELLKPIDFHIEGEQVFITNP